MIDTNEPLWLILIPDSEIRGKQLFHATQDPVRAEALAKEENTVALKLDLHEFFETYGHVTRWEQVATK